MWNRPLNTWRQPGFSQTDTHPVVCVTIRDAMAYAEWLSQETGHTYRLPSAAQWQYAARAGSEEAMLHIQGCIPDRMSGTRVHHGNRFGTGGPVGETIRVAAPSASNKTPYVNLRRG